LIDREFDSCFNRTYNVEFSANPDFSAFKRMLRDGHPDSEESKPALFIYADPVYDLNSFWPSIKDSAMVEDDVFDTFYSQDKEAVKQIFPISK
jgi:hypothetical protein